MAGRQDDTVLLEDVQIIFRNFSGRAGMYNKEGDRSFAVKLDRDKAEELKARGWNIKYLAARDEDDEEQAYVSVKINFNGPRPPKAFLVTSKGRTPLGEGEIEMLDYVDILQIDMILNPYNYTVNGKSGISVYLETIYVTALEDALAQKYDNMGISTVDGPPMQPGTGPSPEPPRI